MRSDLDPRRPRDAGGGPHAGAAARRPVVGALAERRLARGDRLRRAAPAAGVGPGAVPGRARRARGGRRRGAAAATARHGGGVVSAAASGDATVVVVDRVTHAFGPEASDVVLHDVSFEVGPAELVVLAGRSGSGKSTLLHLVAGVAHPTHGTVQVLGRAADSWGDWATVALMPQRSSVSPELSVRENVGLPAALRGRDVDDALLDALGLAEIGHRPAADTSLGEQQRVSAARALALTPTLALLDEPTSHQDDDHVDLVLAALRDAGRAGTALLVATHDPRVIAIADRTVHLAQGRVVDP
ncbi:MAG: ATP-binding cassette domain-containing protein [Frankiales bacterium]|nr:ATP-binding cassette domain-containing protein [Frankiales bacterium]